MIEVDIIIINYNSKQLTANCIDSIEKYRENLTINYIIVDNASTEECESFFNENYPNANLILNKENLGYAAAVNIGVKAANSENIIISNADVEYHKGSVKTLVEYLDKSESIGVVGPQQVYPDGSWEYSYGNTPGVQLGFKELFFLTGIQRGIRKYFWPKLKIDRNPREVDYVDGAVMAFKKRAFNFINGFDEDYFFYTEEADFCYRLKKFDYYVIFNPKATVMHIRGGSSEKLGMSEKSASMLVASKVLFCRKHYNKYMSLFYFKLEKLQTRVKIIFWKMMDKIKNNEKTKNQIKIFQLLNSAWKRELEDEK